MRALKKMGITSINETANLIEARTTFESTHLPPHHEVNFVCITNYLVDVSKIQNFDLFLIRIKEGMDGR